MSELTRRRLIQSGLIAAASASFGPAFWSDAFAAQQAVTAGPYGPLGAPDANGLLLPPGFSSRVIARGNQVMPGRGYVFPISPDGQATYALPDGGWILVTNCELGPRRARRRLRHPVRRRRERDRLLPDPRQHDHELRRRPDALGHMAVVRGDAERPGLGMRPDRQHGSRRAAAAGLVPARGVLHRPGARARLPQRGRRRRLPVPVHAGRLSGPGHGHAGGRVPRRRAGDGPVQARARPAAGPPRGDPDALAGPGRADVPARRGDVVRLGPRLPRHDARPRRSTSTTPRPPCSACSTTPTPCPTRR